LRAAAFCKAARAARKNGATVVLDLDVRWQLWRGRDPRTLMMVLREVDVVWGSAEDLFGLNLDAPTLTASLRPGAVFAGTDGAGAARARGAFGEIVRTAKDDVAIPPAGEGDAFTVAICAELARNAPSPDVWRRALDRGYVSTSRALPSPGYRR
jgi:fructokinase/2-dehydro-3-deoxygluconokinase